MSLCPHCQAEIHEEYNFCIKCEQQVKCTKCNKLLIFGKTRCLHCGEPIVSNELIQAPMNEFTLEEKQTTKSFYRHIDARLSDQAFGQAASMFGGMASAPVQLVTESRNTKPSPPLEKRLLPSPENQEQAIEPIIQDDSIKEESAVISDKEKALSFFEKNGDQTLVAKITDYKGKTKKEQQQRFLLMYVWAYQCIFAIPVNDKEHLINAAKKASIYDKNWNTNINSIVKECLMFADNGYKINVSGENKIQPIIQEIDDEGVKGIAYWKKEKSKTSRKRGYLNQTDEQNIAEWVTEKTSVDEFDIRKLTTGTTFAAFALWILTKELKVETSVKPKVAFEFLKQKYKNISVKQSTFSSALRKNSNKWFKKTPEGLYFLSEIGEAEIISLISEENNQNIDA